MSAVDLAKLLANRRWLHREQPFPHFRAQNVFRPPVYRAMEAAFQSMLRRGLGTGDDPEQFSRSITGYDVYSVTLQRKLPPPFSVFLSRAWHDTLAALTGIAATGDLDGALHHHLPGSLGGLPHNDLNPGWFAAEAAPGEVNLSDNSVCAYRTGATAAPLVRETVRAAALLFYLNNRPWTPGDGGETGLYDSILRPTAEPILAVPPVSNSLLLFECTPYSYHAFMRNRYARNSLIMWLHRPRTEVEARWGEAAIVNWDRSAALNETAPG